MNPRLKSLIQSLSLPMRASRAGRETDRALLDRFVKDHDQGAFASLVMRHGNLVYNACRRVLRNDADADDAFQATFLYLSEKASSRTWQDSIATWLYEVANHIAQNLKKSNLSRRKREDTVG